MKHKLLFLLGSFIFSISIFAQVPCGISSLEACDDNNDGVAIFDLTIYDDIYPFCIVNANSSDYLSPTHHISQEDADAGVNPINNSQTFLGTNGQFIYMRAEPLNPETHSVLSFLTYELVFENCLSLYEITLQDIIIYPNPVSDFLNIKFEKSLTGKLKVEIINLQGKLIMSQNLEGKTLDVSQLNLGIYLLKIKDENSFEKVFKLVKK